MRNLHAVLLSAYDGLTDRIRDLEAEIENLDPSATAELKFILLRLEGLQDYLKEVLDEIEEATANERSRI